jgi:apolipoprotein N-acyltransferase
VSWVYVSLSVFGGMPWWLAGPAAFLFCAVMALFPMAAGWIFKHRQPLHFWQAILFASLLAWATGYAAGCSPVSLAGRRLRASPPSPLAGFAPLLGVHGLSCW